MQPDVGVVVVAAGRGSRVGGPVPKQFQTIAGAPLVLHALRPFLRHPRVGTVVLVLPADAAASPPHWLQELVGERLQLTAGGESRADSTRNGLHALPPSARIVLVHDGARPNPDPAVIDAIIAEAESGHGAIAAIRVSDTIKEVGLAREILRTVPRGGLWRAQTPQGFPRAMLEAAYAARIPSDDDTDEAILVERIGGTVKVVPDTRKNLKVTNEEDLSLAEFLLERGR